MKNITTNDLDSFNKVMQGFTANKDTLIEMLMDEHELYIEDAALVNFTLAEVIFRANGGGEEGFLTMPTSAFMAVVNRR